MAYNIDLHSLKDEIEELRSNEGYLFAGSPKFLGLFGRDSLISAWQLLDYDPSIAKNTIKALASAQGKKIDASTGEQPGKILHEYYKSGVTSREWFDENKAPSGWLKMDRPEYLSIDSTPLFLIVLENYMQKTNDKELLADVWPNAKLAAEWITEYGMQDGFVRYVPNNNKLRSQSWKDGVGEFLENAASPVAVVEVQGYAYMALKAAISMAATVGDNSITEKAGKTADALKSNLERFWMEDERYYATAIDGNGRQLKSATSNPGHLLFTGIVPEERAGHIVERLFQQDMATKYGIRTHSSKDSFFNPFAYQLGSIWPHDNWMIAQGLKLLGYKQQYETVRDSVINAAKELTAIPEYYGVSEEGMLIPLDKMNPVPCDPQAWSLASLINFMSG